MTQKSFKHKKILISFSETLSIQYSLLFYLSQIYRGAHKVTVISDPSSNPRKKTISFYIAQILLGKV